METVAHSFRKPAHVCAHLAASNLSRDFLETGLTHFAQISFDHNRTYEHRQKGNEGEPEMHLKRRYYSDQSRYTNDHGPFNIPQGVFIEGRFSDLSSKLGVGVVELLFYFMEYALFVVRERH